MWRRPRFLLLFVLLGTVIPCASRADDPARKLKKAEAISAVRDDAESRRTALGLTPAREAAAMTFVKQHHAELVELLNYLKHNRPRVYDQAVMDLFRASERLAQQKEQNPERYALELAVWKIESRIELLAAKVKMAGRDSPEGEALVSQLKQLLEERHDLRRQKLAFEAEKLRDRLDRIERQQMALERHRQQFIERELEHLGAAAKASPAGNSAVPKRREVKQSQPDR